MSCDFSHVGRLDVPGVVGKGGGVLVLAMVYFYKSLKISKSSLSLIRSRGVLVLAKVKFSKYSSTSFLYM